MTDHLYTQFLEDPFSPEKQNFFKFLSLEEKFSKLTDLVTIRVDAFAPAFSLNHPIKATTKCKVTS
jgi:hypothetical protein